MKHKIGIIGMIREELKEDFWGTLQKMADLGYQGIEGALLVRESEQEMKDNRKRLADLGMETVALSCSHNKAEDLPQVIKNAQVLGVKYLVNYWSEAETKDDALKLAETHEKMAVQCQKEGLSLMYHNHDHEFVSRLGDKGHECIFDIFYENTEVLKFQLDIGWVTFAGADPVSIIRRCGSRIPELHIKDITDRYTRGHFCAIGCGIVKCFEAIEAAAAQGTEWMVVEQDCAGNISLYESAVASILNIREAGLR